MNTNIAEDGLDKFVYRIVSFDRLLQLFTTNTNVLINPKKWEDPFENFILKSPIKLLNGEIVKYSLHQCVYGQCWTQDKASDAMWRIYSPQKDGFRIRTTARKLLTSVLDATPSHSRTSAYLGKVSYLSEKELIKYANGIFDDDGISGDNVFKSLLVKRKAFKHENEVRLLVDLWDEREGDDFYKYQIDPHSLISQIMVDPRKSDADFESVKLIIERCTGFTGEIKKSRLYSPPDNIVLNVSDYLKQNS